MFELKPCDKSKFESIHSPPFFRLQPNKCRRKQLLKT
jgi:hypothetical protein